MPRFIVSATGYEPQNVRGATWLEALGTALNNLGMLDAIEALACESLPNGTVVARNVKTGQGFVVMQGDADPKNATPAPVGRRRSRADEPFGVHNLAQSVFRENLKHELRTPLNAILGYTGLLREEAMDRDLPRMAYDLDQVSDCASGLLELIDAGLEAQRITAGEVKFQRLTFGVSELLEDAAAAFSAEAERRGNRVEVHADRRLGTMRSDPQNLRAALLEILRWNNLRIRGGHLVLDAVVEADTQNTEWVTLCVCDSGPPISQDESSALFQVLSGPDGNLGQAAATIRRGTARELVRKQGGDLDLITGPEGRPVLGIRVPRGR